MGGGADGKVSIERLCLSPYVEKPFNSKLIKKFRTGTKKSSSVFCVSGFLCYIYYEHYERFTYRYEYVYFTYPYHGYVTNQKAVEVTKIICYYERWRRGGLLHTDLWQSRRTGFSWTRFSRRVNWKTDHVDWQAEADHMNHGTECIRVMK